jgi:serine/threonine protein kinase
MEDGKYTGVQADMFAAGVVLFMMYTGGPPFFSAKSHDRGYKHIRERNFTKFWQMHEKGKPEGFFPNSFKKLMNSFFSADASLRPTFDSL